MVAEVFSGLTAFTVILLIVGFILIGIEMKMPGISFPGIAGAICLVVSVLLTADNFIEGTIMTVAIFIVLGIMLGVIVWLLSKGKLVKPIILAHEQKKEEGYISSSDLMHLVGKEGVAITDLRPSGIGEFGGQNFDIISEGQYILKGTAIKIHQVQGSKVIVKIK